MFLRPNLDKTGPPSRNRKGETMKNLFLAATALTFVTVAGTATPGQPADAPPPWAYGLAGPPPNPMPPAAAPAAPAPLDNTVQHTLSGSNATFTRAQIANRYGPADWYPEDHPTMPDIVAHGRESANPQVFACGLFHYPNGKGRPADSHLTGPTSEDTWQRPLGFQTGAPK